MAGEQIPGKSAPDDKIINTSPWRKNSEDMDWDSLRHEWVTTNISIVGLAEKYGLSVTSVRNHYNRYNWKYELKKFHNMIDEAYDKALEEKAKEIVDRATELDAVILSASEKIASVIEDQINDLIQEVTIDENGNRPVLTKLDDISRTLKVASETLKNAHYNIRLASDRATNIVQQDANVISPLNKDEENRIEEELGLMGDTKVQVKEELINQNGKSQDSEK